MSDIKHINQKGSLFSACFYQMNNYDNDIYIITSNDNYSQSDCIKIFDFNGNKIKDIKYSNDRTFFIDIFYDININNQYIVSATSIGVKSYDIEDNKLYHEYFDNCENEFNYCDHNSIVFLNETNKVKMIESSDDGNIRIWDFHTAQLLNKIVVSDDKLYALCLWNKDYLFVGCDDNTLKLIDLRKNFVINNIREEGLIITIRKIDHIKYKDCLITQDWRNKIKIWTINN